MPATIGWSRNGRATQKPHDGSPASGFIAIGCNRSARPCVFCCMRSLELVLALIIAVIAFVVVKLVGLLIKFALIAALAGLILGFVIGRLLRRPA